MLELTFISIRIFACNLNEIKCLLSDCLYICGDVLGLFHIECVGEMVGQSSDHHDEFASNTDQ